VTTWSETTLQRLDDLKRQQREARAISGAAFERVRALGRELFSLRGSRGLAVHRIEAGLVVFSVAMHDPPGAYRHDQITAETATLALTSYGYELPEPDVLGARCYAAWQEMTRFGAASNAADKALEEAIRDAVEEEE